MIKVVAINPSSSENGRLTFTPTRNSINNKGIKNINFNFIKKYDIIFPTNRVGKNHNTKPYEKERLG